MLHLLSCFVSQFFSKLALALRRFWSLVTRSLEETQQLEVERALVLANQGSVMWQPQKGNKLTKGQMSSRDLSQCITAVCGVILPRLVPRPEEQVSL